MSSTEGLIEEITVLARSFEGDAMFDVFLFSTPSKARENCASPEFLI